METCTCGATCPRGFNSSNCKNKLLQALKNEKRCEASVVIELSQVGSVLTVESPLAVESSSYQNSEPPDHVGSVLNSDSSSAAWAYVNAVQEAAAPNSGIPPQT